jgi:molybdopterin guanine dinucleotide-containing S/N-oxide reductase-like protein
MSREPMSHGENTVVKGLSFSGPAQDSNPVEVDCKNGRVIRIRPFRFDKEYDRKPWKIEAKGKVFEASNKSLIPPFTLAYKNRINSPNRTMYPLKRVDWDPNGERNPQNRGISKYERISWDEATDIIASEIKRVIRQYGPEAILSQSDGHGETKIVHNAHGCNQRLLELMGGFTQQIRNPDSWEGWYWGAKHVWGNEPVGKQRYQSNIVPDIAEHAKNLLFIGCDPETTTWGWGGQTVSQLCYWFTELGIRQIYVCPEVNYGAAVHGDKWIPILPNTDAALYLAIAYLWITQGTYDKAYVETHVVGFNKFRDYVLGKEDGIAKTPQWAAAKTAVPSRIIKAVARVWSSAATCTVHGNGGTMARSPYSTENMRMEVCLLGMQGLGKPGRHMFTTIEWGLYCCGEFPGWTFGNEIPVPGHSIYPNLTVANQGLQRRGAPTQIIPKTLIHEAINNPPIKWYGTTWARERTENQFVEYRYPAQGCSEIHMMWTDSPALMTCWNDSNYLVQAYRNPKIEFTLAQHPWFENDCEFADIVLPVTTKFENVDIGVDHFTAEYGSIFLDRKCIEPRGESRSDYEAVCAIAEKLGILEEYTQGRSVEDWIKFGFDSCKAQGLDVSWEEFQEKGHYVIPNDPNWQTKEIGLRNFAEHPDKYPLSTPTGKLEFYSQRLADHFPDDQERPPVPHWVEGGPGWSHDERLSGERAKKYPFLCLTNHPRWRVHSEHDDMQWLREIETCKIAGPDGYAYQTMWINPKDAAKKKIKHGDVVRVFNERGSVLLGAYVTERMMPGVLYVDHGARYDPIGEKGLDRGGAINTICPRAITSKNCAGMASGGFLLDVESVNLDELRRQYPEAFNRPYSPAAGLKLERVLDAAP